MSKDEESIVVDAWRWGYWIGVAMGIIGMLVGMFIFGMFTN